MPIDDISPLSNYPRIEEPTISAQHSAVFLALQFWQSVILVMFSGFGIYAMIMGNLPVEGERVFWLRLVAILCLMSMKHLKRFGRVVGWKPATMFVAYLSQSLGLLACIGAIGPWVVQYYAAKSIARYQVDVWWPFISNSKVLEAIAPSETLGQ